MRRKSMKIALAQMRMTGNVQENLEKSLKFCDLAEDCDLLFFPEIQDDTAVFLLELS